MPVNIDYARKVNVVWQTSVRNNIVWQTLFKQLLLYGGTSFPLHPDVWHPCETTSLYDSGTDPTSLWFS